MRPLRIFTPVFAPKYIERMRRSLAVSLRWPKNQEAIKAAKWTLFIHPTEFDQVMSIATSVLPEEQIETIEAVDGMSDLERNRGGLMCHAFVKALRKCLGDGSQMLVSTVDFIWSDGTIANMIKLAQQKDVCVALPHPRVLPSICDHLDKPLSSPELVSLALNQGHAHKSWTMSQLGQHGGTRKGGILWRKNGGNVWTLQHRMPSPYLLNLRPEDITFFEMDKPEKRAAWGAIDHQWAEHLCESQRWRMLLSSDLGFMAEVTSPEDNVPPDEPCDQGEPDAFWTQERHHHLLHQKLNRQFVATFRGMP